METQSITMNDIIGPHTYQFINEATSNPENWTTIGSSLPTASLSEHLPVCFPFVYDTYFSSVEGRTEIEFTSQQDPSFYVKISYEEGKENEATITGTNIPSDAKLVRLEGEKDLHLHFRSEAYRGWNCGVHIHD